MNVRYLIIEVFIYSGFIYKVKLYFLSVKIYPIKWWFIISWDDCHKQRIIPILKIRCVFTEVVVLNDDFRLDFNTQ